MYTAGLWQQICCPRARSDLTVCNSGLCGQNETFPHRGACHPELRAVISPAGTLMMIASKRRQNRQRGQASRSTFNTKWSRRAHNDELGAQTQGRSTRKFGAMPEKASAVDCQDDGQRKRSLEGHAHSLGGSMEWDVAIAAAAPCSPSVMRLPSPSSPVSLDPHGRRPVRPSVLSLRCRFRPLPCSKSAVHSFPGLRLPTLAGHVHNPLDLPPHLVRAAINERNLPLYRTHSPLPGPFQDRVWHPLGSRRIRDRLRLHLALG